MSFKESSYREESSVGEDVLDLCYQRNRLLLVCPYYRFSGFSPERHKLTFPIEQSRAYWRARSYASSDQSFPSIEPDVGIFPKLKERGCSPCRIGAFKPLYGQPRGTSRHAMEWSVRRGRLHRPLCRFRKHLWMLPNFTPLQQQFRYWTSLSCLKYKDRMSSTGGSSLILQENFRAQKESLKLSEYKASSKDMWKLHQFIKASPQKVYYRTVIFYGVSSFIIGDERSPPVRTAVIQKKFPDWGRGIPGLFKEFSGLSETLRFSYSLESFDQRSRVAVG